MKVDIIGGGPGGLYFAILAKKAWPAMRITVYERNRADDTFGFGVVFSDETLETFEKYDLESYRAITANFAYWDDVEIHFKGTVHRIGGNGFCGCARVTLLKLLHERARAARRRAEIPDRDRSRGAARRRPRRRGGRHQLAHPRAACGCVPARDRPAAEQVRLDGLDPAVRCLHVLLPRDRARHLHRALLPVRARPIDLGDGDRPGDLRARRARQARRDAVGEIPRGRVRQGARRPQADRQPLALAQLPDHPLRELDARQHRADRRRQGDRAFLHRLRHQARDGGRDRAVQCVQGDRGRGCEDARWRTTRPSGGSRSRRPSTPPTCRWSGSSTCGASGTWTRGASPSA